MTAIFPIKNLRLAFGLATFLVLGACASTPKESFYTLNPVASPATTQSPKTAAARTIAIGPVRVPEIVDRPQLVVRQGDNRVEVLEQHRWAQPLRAEIAQALVATLANRLPQARVMSDRDAGSANADVRVAVDITRFDAMPADAVVMQARWTMRATGVQAPVSAELTVREAVGGTGYDAIAAAFSKAVERAGNDIASSVSALAPAK